jgi:son of sevenless-like protein
MSVSFKDFLALQSDISMRQPRDVPADLPFMAVMDRALCMVEVAALKKSLDHLAPFTACVIGIVRAVLSSAQCLSRDAPNLQRSPELQKARKTVLGELARLVGQTKKVGGEMEGEVELTYEEYQEELEKTMKISMTLFNNVQLFVVMCLDQSIQIQEAPRKSGLLDVVEEPDAGAYTTNASTGQSAQQNGSLKRSPSVGPRSTSLVALRGAKSAGDLRGGQVGAARNSLTDPIKVARRARVIHGRGARSQSQSTTVGSISTFRDMDAQGRTEESSSSLSSLESSPSTSGAIAFPCGACKSPVVLTALRTVLDSLLGVTAAFIGHAQLHSRTSHPASKGTLIALTRQLVDLVRKLLTIVEAVVQHEVIAMEKQREVLLLSQYKDTLYTSTNIAVDGVRELTNQPPTPSETEDQERAAVVAAVTDTLKLCAECGNAVRLCLSRKMGEQTLVIWIPRLPVSPEPTPTSTTEPGLTNVIVGPKEATTPKSEMVLKQRAKTTDGLRTQFMRDGEELTLSVEEKGDGDVVAEECMGETRDQTLRLTAQDQDTVVTTESTSGRPRGDSGSSASTSTTNLFEDGKDHRSRTSSARTSGEPKALDATEVDQPDEADTVFSTMANWNDFGEQESIPPTPLTPDLDKKQWIPTPRMQEERRPSVQHCLQRGDMILDPEGHILAATFGALIERLTHPEERPDFQLMTHFLLTFRVFATSVQLADALIERWAHVGPPEESRPANFNPHVWDIQTHSIRARVVNFITEWTKIHWYPPTDMASLPKLLDFMKGETSDAARRLVGLFCTKSMCHRLVGMDLLWRRPRARRTV